jgi:hypothetical protein
MESPTTQAQIPALEAGSLIPIAAVSGQSASKAADYIYRIAALTAGLALLMFFA